MLLPPPPVPPPVAGRRRRGTRRPADQSDPTVASASKASNAVGWGAGVDLLGGDGRLEGGEGAYQSDSTVGSASKASDARGWGATLSADASGQENAARD